MGFFIGNDHMFFFLFVLNSSRCLGGSEFISLCDVLS